MNFRNLLVKLGLVVGNAASRFEPSGVAALLLEAYAKRREQAQLRLELEALMGASFGRFREELADAMGELRLQLAEGVRGQVEAYLSQFQASAKQAARSLGDPSATTVPATVSIDSAPELAAFLPQRPPRFTVGDVVPGLPSWKLIEPLGCGGFGEVWKARHEDDGDFAAFKFFTDPTARSRFTAAEAKVLKEIHQKGPTDGVVKLLQAEARQDPPWIQFEFIDGGDLTRLPESWKGLSDGERVQRVQGAIRTLAATAGHFHDLGVVHRDLKPSNVLMRKMSGGYKLVIADFGISKIVPSQGAGSTPKNASVNTIKAYTALYASPQQKKFLPADRRDDVYALGVLWYQLLRGDLSLERPSGDGWKRVLTQLGVTGEHIALLNRCWDDEPDERPADGKALAEAIAAGSPGTQKPAHAEPLPLAELVLEPVRNRTASWLAALFVILSAGVLASVLLVWVLLLPGKKQDTATESGLPELAPAGAPTTPMGSSGQTPAPKAGAPKPGEEQQIEIADNVFMTFCWVPAGECQLGSPKAERDAAGAGDNESEERRGKYSTNDFWLGKYPVTQSEWTAVMGDNPSWCRAGGVGADKVNGLDTTRFPVDNVTWDMCQKFLEKANAHGGIVKAFGKSGQFALPHENQWEYACRGGLGNWQPFYWGKELNGTQANCKGKFPFGTATAGEFKERPTPVGDYATKAPHPWGLCDMSGNVYNWCDNLYEQTTSRVLRGGSWSSDPARCRAAYRYSSEPYDRFNDHFGCRVCLRMD